MDCAECGAGGAGAFMHTSSRSGFACMVALCVSDDCCVRLNVYEEASMPMRLGRMLKYVHMYLRNRRRAWHFAHCTTRDMPPKGGVVNTIWTGGDQNGRLGILILL
eukprot:scaffold32325_cov26-Tisochrysis_lutea.AAC.1